MGAIQLPGSERPRFFVLYSADVLSCTECLALMGSFYGWAETVSGTDGYLP